MSMRHGEPFVGRRPSGALRPSNLPEPIATDAAILL
jgi:hypothetical protein